MKKLLQVACLCVVAAVALYGQRGGGFRGGGGGGVRGGGFRGGVARGGFVGPSHYGGYGRGYGFGGRGYGRGPFYRSRFGFGFYSPWIYPAYWGGYGYPGYGGYWDSGSYPQASYYGGAPGPNVSVIYVPPPTEYAAPAPAQPSTREYAQPAAPPASLPSVYFQIAARDGSVYAGIAYWVEAGTLHYLDLEGKHHEMPVDQVDRARSEKLNAGRQIEFRLPMPR